MNLQIIARSLIRESVREAEVGTELTLDQLNGIADSVIGTLSDAGLLVEPKEPARRGRPPKAESAAKATSK